jgi:uncharacterized protein (TIGR03435 family)
MESRVVVRAMLPHGSSKQQFQEMTKSLLAERFHLTFHTTVAGQRSAYELLTGPGRPKLGPVTGAGNEVTTQEKKGSRLSREMLGSESDMKWIQRRTSDGQQLMTFKQCGMAYLAERLSFVFSGHKVPVIDHTGITGKFDFQFEYPSELNAAFAPTAEDPFGRWRVADPTVYRRVSPLLGKQLGLQLRPTKVDLKTMVIDHLDRAPTED